MTYGCHNRPDFVERFAVQDGWVHGYMSGHTRVAIMRAAPFTMARECQYTKTALGQADPKCDGCRHRLNI